MRGAFLINFAFQKNNQFGDTIVEVLIAILIIASVLMGAFLVTQRSTTAVRSGQEHSEMLQILQGQVERVRTIALAQPTSEHGIFEPDEAFCIDSVSGEKVLADNPQCQKIQTLYNVSIVYDKDTHVFTFTGQWLNLTGGKDQEQLTYRVYSGEPVAATGAPIPSPGLDAAAEKPVPTGVKCRDSHVWTDPICWYAGIKNTSINPPGVLVKCIWDWGDGAIVSYPASASECINGNMAYHQYVPFGSGFTPTRYFVTVTNQSTTSTKTSAPPVDVFVPF